MGRIVVRESEKEFVPVDYGKRKILIDPESAGARHVRVSITEYAPGNAHEMHRHPNQEGNNHHRQPNKQGDLPAVQHPGQHISAESIGAKWVLPRGRLQLAGQVRHLGIVW